MVLVDPAAESLRKAPLRLEVAEHKVLLPLQLRRTRAAVFHSPAFDPPRRSPVPWVYTLHDVIPLEFDYTAGLGRRTWERYAPRIRGADAVVSVSRWSADRAIALFELDPRRVHVIHHGSTRRTAASSRIRIPTIPTCST